MDAPDLLIVIPARGGSKGLPRKNARMLDDLPLLGWTAQAVKQSGLNPAACVLSTDDDAIAAIGREVGLDVPFIRPAAIADDAASAQSVALHALDWLQRDRGLNAEFVMWLQPTSPFRPPRTIARAYELMRGGSADAVVGVKAIHRSLGTLFRLDDDTLLSPLDANAAMITRRQEVKTLYTPNGAMYIVRARMLRAQNTFFPKHSIALPMDKIASLDIDDATDWSIAEAIARGGKSWRGA